MRPGLTAQWMSGWRRERLRADGRRIGVETKLRDQAHGNRLSAQQCLEQPAVADQRMALWAAPDADACQRIFELRRIPEHVAGNRAHAGRRISVAADHEDPVDGRVAEAIHRTAKM